jgi:hypothetical protein
VPLRLAFVRAAEAASYDYGKPRKLREAGRRGIAGGPAPGPLTTRLRCSVDVPGRTLDCRPASATSARGDLLLGGQNVFVKLRSSDVAYSAPVLSANVSVQNLLAQAMGTTGDLQALGYPTRLTVTP